MTVLSSHRGACECMGYIVGALNETQHGVYGLNVKRRCVIAFSLVTIYCLPPWAISSLYLRSTSLFYVFRNWFHLANVSCRSPSKTLSKLNLLKSGSHQYQRRTRAGPSAHCARKIEQKKPGKILPCLPSSACTGHLPASVNIAYCSLN